MTDTVCLPVAPVPPAVPGGVLSIPSGAGTRAELLWHPQPSSRPSLTRVAEAEESWGRGGVESSYFSFCHTFFCKGRGDLFCPQQNQVCISFCTLFFVLNPQQPSGAFQYGVMERKQAISQAERCRGVSSPPGTASRRPTEVSRGCKVQSRRGWVGRWRGSIPSSPLERLHLALQTLQGNELSPSEARWIPCLPYHLGFKCLSHTLGVAAKYCAFCTSLHLDFKPLQLVFGSGFQAFSSPISYPHWFPL